jgi:hypothetical protein
MTIKQQGGIFGRNPTFNDINVDNDISISGDATVTGKLGVGGTNAILGFYAEKDNGSGYVGGFRSTNSSPYLTVQTTGGVTNLQGINSGFTDVAAIGLQPSGGNINVGAGNFVMTSGYGIDFSATSGTGTSELFDDYEEGTWTPAINGTADTTYSTQYGWYTKVGNLVSVGFELTVNTEGTITGNAIIAGLPFASGASDSKSSGSLSYSGSSGFSSVWQGIVIGNNQSLISIFVKSAASGSTISLNGSDFFANGTSIIGQLTYKV